MSFLSPSLLSYMFNELSSGLIFNLLDVFKLFLINRFPYRNASDLIDMNVFPAFCVSP